MCTMEIGFSAWEGECFLCAMALSWGLTVWEMSKSKGDGWPSRSLLPPDLMYLPLGLPSHQREVVMGSDG